MHIDRNILRVAGLMAAGSMGAGMFGLPHIFSAAGWLLTGVYLAAFAGLLVWIHTLYLRAIKATGGEHRLLGLVERFYGGYARPLATIVILGGLLLVLLVYLVLAEHFLGLIFPGMSFLVLGFFWFAVSVPAFFGLRRIVAAETAGIVVIGAIVLFIFLASFGESQFRPAPWNWDEGLLPFAPVLFALAGWTAIGPIAEYGKKTGLSIKEMSRGIAFGALLTVLLYGVFTTGILRSAPALTPDTISGLVSWPLPKLAVFLALGLFALWTAYLAVSFEARRSFHADLGWSEGWSTAVVLFLPPALYLIGLSDFLRIVGLVGGVFLALEYIFILLVSRRALHLHPGERRFAGGLIAIFILAAIYEFRHFLFS